MIGFPGANGGVAHTRQQRDQFVLELRLIGGRRALDDDRSKVGSATQRDPEDNIGDSVCRIYLHFGVYRGLEVSILAQKCGEMVEPSIEVYRIKRRLDRITRHLNQLRIGKAFGAGKLVDAEVKGGSRMNSTRTPLASGCTLMRTSVNLPAALSAAAV